MRGAGPRSARDCVRAIEYASIQGSRCRQMTRKRALGMLPVSVRPQDRTSRPGHGRHSRAARAGRRARGRGARGAPGPRRRDRGTRASGTHRPAAGRSVPAPFRAMSAASPWRHPSLQKPDMRLMREPDRFQDASRLPRGHRITARPSGQVSGKVRSSPTTENAPFVPAEGFSGGRTRAEFP